MATTGKDVDLSSLVPKTAVVYIGAMKLEIREPSIIQAQAALRVLSGVELEKLVTPFIQLVRGDGSAAVSVAGVMGRLADVGPALIEAARPVLGEQFGPAVEQGAVACLDSRRVMSKLAKAGEEYAGFPESAEYDDDGTYIGCPELRAWIREEITPKQAIHVLVSCLGMMDIVGSVGNLLGALMPVEQETPTQTPKAKPAAKKKG